jgi:hypothetical protein
MSTMSALPSEAGALLSRSSILILAALLSAMAAIGPERRQSLYFGTAAIGFGSYLVLEQSARRRLRSYIAKKAAELHGALLHADGAEWKRQMADALELLRLGNQTGFRVHRGGRPFGWSRRRH